MKKSSKNLIVSVFALQVIVLLVLPVTETHSAIPDVKVDVDWAEFMGNLDPVWDELPTVPKHGPMIGNGMLGTYLILNKDAGEIRFEMSRGDLCDVRPGFNRRKTNGYFKLKLSGGTSTGKCRLDLWDAQLKADLSVNSSVLSLRVFTDANSDVIVFELTKRGADLAYVWDWVPDNRGWAGTVPKVPNPYTPYSEPIFSDVEGCKVSVQDMPVSKTYSTHGEPAASQHATAWRVIEDSGKTIVYASTTYSYRASTAKQTAVDNVNQAVAKGFKRLEAEHQAWWHDFYQKNFVTLPHKFEWFHWMQMYKIACMTRKDAPVIVDLVGPWFDRDLVWNGIWFNWNTQKQYCNVFTSNHPELASSLLNGLWNQRANMYDAASGGYGVPWGGCGALNIARGDWRDAACLAWLLSLSWEQYQCTMDSDMLLNKLFPLLKGSYNYMKYHYLATGTDGKLHFKPGASPEYFVRDKNNQKITEFEDITFRIATMRWVCNTIIKINQRYGNSTADAVDCQSTLDKLVPYCIDPNQGFMIGKDTPLAHAHRHDSHELQIFPYYEYTPDDPQQAEIIRKTLAHHKATGFQDQGMADASWGIMRAMFGDGNDALWSITHETGYVNHPDVSPFTTRLAVFRTAYVEEGPFLGDRVIQEMLLQSWGDDIIRVFPAVPSHADWDNLAFNDFRAKGAFLVSAKRKDRKTSFIKIESLAGEACKVKTDMAGPVKLASDFGCSLTDLGNGIVQINNLKKGQWCILYTGDSVPELSIEALDSTRTPNLKTAVPNTEPEQILYNSDGSPFVRKNFYPKFSWDTTPMYYMFGDTQRVLKPDEVEFIAERTDFLCIEKSHGSKQLGAAELGAKHEATAFKKIKPDMKVLFYFNSAYAWPFTSYNQAFTRNKIAEHPELKKFLIVDPKTGELAHRSNVFFFDVLNPELREWWSNTVAKGVADSGCDGAFIDQMHGFHWLRADKSEDVQKAMGEMMALLKEKMGPDKILLGNNANQDIAKYVFPAIDASMFEHYNEKLLSKESLLQDWDDMLRIAKAGKMSIFRIGVESDRSRAEQDDQPGQRRGLDRQAQMAALAKERVEYYLACYLIGAQPYSYFQYGWGWTLASGSLHDFPELLKPLGAPKGPYQRTTPDGWEFTRKFEHASVWVNTEKGQARIIWQ